MNSKKVSEFGKFISNQDLLDYIKSVSFKKPTQVQGDCFPKLLGEGNFTVQGRTGSGKTHAYLLPVIQRLKELEGNGDEALVASPKTIILLPTRELALQIFGVAKEISHFAKLRIRKLVGGDKGKSLNSLYNSQIDILITTPDRCYRAFKNKELSGEDMKFLVFDEADQLLDPSFRKTVSEIAKIVTNPATQVFLISASRPVDFPKIIEESFLGRKFEVIGKGEENVLNHKVSTFNISLENDDKFIYVKSFVKKMNKTNGLIFTGNKARAKAVFDLLKDNGQEKLFVLHKDMEIKERVDIVDKFRKNGGTLVATDIFARGIDITHLQWVLNFDIPSDADYYLHRSGRVGRAGRTGDVFNFITSKDGHRQRRINEELLIQGRGDLKIPAKITKRR